MWTKCQPCTSYFKLSSLFDPKLSSSYKKLESNHVLARFFAHDSKGKKECTFNFSYMSGQSCAGVGSVDRLVFPSVEKNLRALKGLFLDARVASEGSDKVQRGATHLEMRAYGAVKAALVQHFDWYKLTRVLEDPRTRLELCYHLKQGFGKFLSLVLHL
ncbi:Aspartic proteinase CDR1 [Striga hermonthica]|uniref:Aspartic proteinase CDR1 n=1 Tax=Striga hermonthica TaxID=68872 RepID=A0A9N7RFZ8_STRHE|nr:Aspartic proteinase CDR1 [Striga hermonthica]